MGSEVISFLFSMCSECAERLFIVCVPRAPAPAVLKEAFSCFGNLIEVFMLNNRNHGFAKYAGKDLSGYRYIL